MPILYFIYFCFYHFICLENNVKKKNFPRRLGRPSPAPGHGPAPPSSCSGRSPEPVRAAAVPWPDSAPPLPPPPSFSPPLLPPIKSGAPGLLSLSSPRNRRLPAWLAAPPPPCFAAAAASRFLLLVVAATDHGDARWCWQREEDGRRARVFW